MTKPRLPSSHADAAEWPEPYHTSPPIRRAGAIARPMHSENAETARWLAGWSVNIAVFALALTLLTFVLHRFSSLSTPVASNTSAVAVGLSGLAIAIAIAAMIIVWRRGRGGSAVASAGLALGLLQLVWPAVLALIASETAPIADVSTDLLDPPPFIALASVRGPGTNGPNHPGRQAGLHQQSAYPDLRPMLAERSLEETHQVVVETLRRLGWTIVADNPPGEQNVALVEAFERTLVLGFYDDLSIRVRGDETRSRVDMRSASRYGQNDLGRNAERVRQFYQELRLRLDATVPGARGGKGARGRERPESAKVKRAKSGDREQGRDRKQPDRA